MKGYLDRIGRVILCVMLISAAQYQVLACQCTIPAACQAYTIATRVFTGKLVKIEPDINSAVETLIASFAVARIFKGNPESVEKVKIVIGSCDRKFSVGEDYFVYKQPIGQEYFTCDTTRLLSKAKPDLEYASSLSDTDPIFTIQGYVSGVEDKDLKKIKMTIDDGKKVNNISLFDGRGFFTFTVKKDAQYTVTISLPKRSTTRVTELGALWDTIGDQVKYTTKFRPNECDSRSIDIQLGKTDGDCSFCRPPSGDAGNLFFTDRTDECDQIFSKHCPAVLRDSN